MSKKEKTLKGKTPSRRKFFKAAAATGAAAAATLATNFKSSSCMGWWNFPREC